MLLPKDLFWIGTHCAFLFILDNDLLRFFQLEIGEREKIKFSKLYLRSVITDLKSDGNSPKKKVGHRTSTHFIKILYNGNSQQSTCTKKNVSPLVPQSFEVQL